MNDQRNDTYLMKKMVARSAVAICLAAGLGMGCSGKQNPETDPVVENAREAGSGESGDTTEASEDVTPERELTPEERAALRLEAAHDLLASVEEDYTSGSASNADMMRRLQEVSEELPDEPRVWFNIGVLKYEDGDRAGAIEAWEKAGEVDPAFASGLANISWLQLNEGDTDAAMDTIEECIERLSSEPGCNINAAYILRQEALADGEFTRDEASPIVERLRYALFGDARNSAAYSDLSRVYFEVGMMDLARLVTADAIQRGLETADLYNRLGLIELENDNVIAALQAFRSAVELDPEYADAWMNIGAMTLSYRDYQASADAFGRAMELRRDSDEAKLSYAVALRGLLRLDEAEALYNELLESNPQNLAALYNLAVLHQEGHQNYEKAVEYYELFQERNDEGDTELAQDVAQRIDVLTELIEILGSSGI